MPTAIPETPALTAGAPSPSLIQTIRTGAGRCVACGLCLPHCPTYRKTRSELESPRGRVSLMLGFAKGELKPGATLEAHLSQCLLCRACEAVCPAGVPFGEIMDATRVQLHIGRRPSLRQRLGLRGVLWLTHSRTTTFLAHALRLYQRSGLQALLRRAGLLRRLGLAKIDAELPPLKPYAPLAPHYSAAGTKRGAVALFTGCVARLTDVETLHSSVRVLTALGYDVHVPRQQTCCGALHQHSGDAHSAGALMRRNVEAFRANDIDAILTTASGCAATLVECPDKTFASKITDVSAFLAKLEWPENFRLRSLPKRIAVHDPCTLANVLRARAAPYTLLQRIPDATVQPLSGNHQCCGGAGAYHLEYPDMARRLRDDKVDAVRQAVPDILATSNIGCALHVAAGLRDAGINLEVVHPITLLARQLDA